MLQLLLKSRYSSNGSSGTLRGLSIRLGTIVCSILLLLSADLNSRVVAQAPETISSPSNSDRSWYYDGWSGPGCVLLKNGNVLRGDVLTQGTGLLVKLDNTGEISIGSGDVVAVKSTLNELYEHQVSKTERWEAGEHWHLAKWCLRYELVDQAQYHYLQLKELAGNHASFKRMEAEIKSALLRDPILKEAMRKSDDQQVLSSDNDASSLNQPQATTASSENEQGKSSVSPTVDTSHLVLDLYTQEYFRQQVHPFIMLKCGQSGCHGGAVQTRFQITRSGSQRNRRTSSVSLASAIQFMVEPDFEKTRFMAMATSAHGTKTSAPLNINIPADRALLDRLRFWHAALHRNATRSAVPAQIANVGSSGDGRQRSGPRIATNSGIPAGNYLEKSLSSQQPGFANGALPSKSADIITNGTEEHVLVESDKMLPEVGSGLLTLEREIAKLEAIEKSRKQPDLHDPAEFNRQFEANP